MIFSYSVYGIIFLKICIWHLGVEILFFHAQLAYDENKIDIRYGRHKNHRSAIICWDLWIPS